MERKSKSAFSALKRLTEKPSADDTESYECQIITPMYCGGVIAGTTDKEMPVRASSIRGHLRFWWRIVSQHNNDATTRSLAEREQAIWGGITGKAQASQVQIEVIVKRPFLHPKSDFLKGVEYALGGSDKKEVNSFWGAGNLFELKVRFDDRLNAKQKQEVKESIRWWASFGGIGGRTRRGFGALKIKNLPAVTADEVALLGGKLCLKEPEQSADKAWRKAIHDFKAFRQGVGTGRNEGQGVTGRGQIPGRSRWPEPDALRRIYRTHSRNHAPIHQAGNYFPRAAFGLPIQFKFKDERIGEPKQSTLIPKEKERMASPLILRPYNDRGTWQPAALLLPCWSETLVRLKELEINAGGKRQKAPCWPDNVAEQHEIAKQIKPMKKGEKVLDNHPLLAFLDFFKGA